LAIEAPPGAAFLLAFLTALAATPIALLVARRTKFYDHPRDHKAHPHPTPYLGGLAIVVAFLAGVLPLTDEAERVWPIAVGVLALWLIGTVDDWRTVPPAPRLVVTGAAATLLWATGLGWSIFESDLANLSVTCLWVVGLVNAFNLMDNMDGAAGSVAAACATGVALLALVEGDAFVGALALALSGACLGFLRYNLASPARIFLGDGGSMPIGFIIAVAIAAVPYEDARGWSTLVPASLLVGVPILDTTLVVVSRNRRGVPFWRGGRDHLTHRLHSRVSSIRIVVGGLSLIQLALCGLGVLLLQEGNVSNSLAFISVATVGLVVMATSAHMDALWKRSPMAEMGRVDAKSEREV
jgi:UDP-GlcNAc:undecaprenyl-phosphate/decaprenyl-phosphate GlcNAc-1-phosphate transferase